MTNNKVDNSTDQVIDDSNMQSNISESDNN